MKKIKEISGKIQENNINKILDKFWMKFLGNLDWIILNKTFMKFKFVEHLRKILKTLNYFLIKFKLILSQVMFQKIWRKFWENSGKITKFWKKSWWKVEEILL